MKTTKPVSTISFNDPYYLMERLEELRKAKVLSWWCFIPHKPEDDEGGKKGHNHLYLEPAKSVQTEDLRAALREFDPEHPDKPKGCLPMIKCNSFGDWYLYGKHDKAYLATKNETRRYQYADEEFISSDSDYFLYMVRSAHIDLTPINRLMELVKQGASFTDAVARGFVPVPQVYAYQKVWEHLMAAAEHEDQTHRGGREGHE